MPLSAVLLRMQFMFGCLAGWLAACGWRCSFALCQMWTHAGSYSLQPHLSFGIMQCTGAANDLSAVWCNGLVGVAPPSPACAEHMDPGLVSLLITPCKSALQVCAATGQRLFVVVSLSCLHHVCTSSHLLADQHTLDVTQWVFHIVPLHTLSIVACSVHVPTSETKRQKSCVFAHAM